MDCKKCKEKLIDYIDGNIEKNENIKAHLDKCEDCKAEYEGLKETVDYLKINSEKINTEREFNLKTRINNKKYKRFTRTGTLAIIISLLLVATVFAAETLGFIDWWKNSSEIQTNAWEELIENGVGQKLDISTVDNGVKITAKGIIADEINTLVLLEIENLNGNRRLVPSYNDMYRDSTQVPWPIIAEGDLERLNKDIPPLVNFSNIYTEDENKVNILVNTNTMTKDKGGFTLNIKLLETMINESEEDIQYVKGNWTLEIKGEKVPSKTYEIGKEVILDGNNLIIDKVVIAPTTTQINYRYKRYNKEKKYNLDEIYFSMEHEGEIFGNSPISYEDGVYSTNNYGYVDREYHLYPLYLQDPKEFTLNIDTKRYSTRDERYYEIDWNNLPQTIEYDGSELTVKSINIGEKETEITIEEDDSKNRKYLKTNINFRKSSNLQDEEYERSYMHDGWYLFRGEYSKSEHINPDKNNDEIKGFPSNKQYNYVYEQKFTIRRDEFREFGIENLYKEKYLLPEYLIIKGQEYIEFPDRTIEIKLK